MNKKSQLTLFIIGGILILSLLFIFLYMKNQSAQNKAETELPTPTKPQFAIESFDNYVTSCLQNSLDNGLNLIGLQGGYIYREQGGFIDKNEFKSLKKEDYLITYLILRDPKEPDLPMYPCLERLAKGLLRILFWQAGYSFALFA